MLSRRTLILLTTAWIASPLPGFAQAPRINTAELATDWMVGRYFMPVTCLGPDGEEVERPLGLSIRDANPARGEHRMRATFFGVDAPEGSTRCYNLLDPAVRDLRGHIFFSYPGFHRPDLGVHDFRKALEQGELKFVIEGGQLHEKTTTAEEATRIDFEGDRVSLVVTEVERGSDGDKLLNRIEPRRRPTATERRVPRRFSFAIEGPGEFKFHGNFLEDTRRWK